MLMHALHRWMKYLVSAACYRWPTCSWHEAVIKWKHYPRYWPFVRGIHRSPVNSPPERPVTRSFDVFFDLCLNKRLSKQLWGWWFETSSRSLWRHCNESGDWCGAVDIEGCVSISIFFLKRAYFPQCFVGYHHMYRVRRIGTLVYNHSDQHFI